jgi:hypothetical protein
MSRTAIYRRWKGMLRRCDTPSMSGYENYGGRGIRVCDSWRLSFMAFLNDMGEPPTGEHSIERIDNDGNYEPGNCRWATKKEQCANRRSSVVLTHNGVSDTLTNWANRTGMNPMTLWNRIRLGWSPEMALETPICESKRNRRAKNISERFNAPNSRMEPTPSLSVTTLHTQSTLDA